MESVQFAVTTRTSLDEEFAPQEYDEKITLVKPGQVEVPKTLTKRETLGSSTIIDTEWTATRFMTCKIDLSKPLFCVFHWRTSRAGGFHRLVAIVNELDQKMIKAACEIDPTCKPQSRRDLDYFVHECRLVDGKLFWSWEKMVKIVNEEAAKEQLREKLREDIKSASWLVQHREEQLAASQRNLEYVKRQAELAKADLAAKTQQLAQLE